MSILNHIRKNALRHIAAMLATLMAYETAATPLAQAAMIAPQPNLESAISSKVSSANIGARPSDAAFIAPFKVPASVGSTVEIHAPLSASRLVYHLQDVHDMVGPQTNLSDMVSRLEAYAAQQKKSLIVAVEGGVGVINTDSISANTAPAKEAVSSALLRSGFLFGEEHAAINHAPGRIRIVGVESPALYNRNLIAREGSVKSRERILATVREIKGQLNRLKDHNFNALLSTLEKNRVAVEEGRMDMSAYLTFLDNTNPVATRRQPMVARMLAIGRQEKSLDFALVEKEGRQLVEEIINKKSDREVQKMMADATSLREGRVSPLSYYNGLLAEATRSYPALNAYTAYLRNADAVNPDQLFMEIQALETEIAKGLVRHPIAFDLYTKIRWTERQERFFSLNMVPQEWAVQKNTDLHEIFKAHADIRAFVAEQVGDLGYKFATPPLSFNDLRVAVKGAGDFYRAAEARDTEMVSNLEKVLNKYDREHYVVAFVAGGFHTPGLTRELRRKGLAYQVIRPQLDSEVALNTDLTYPDQHPKPRLLPTRAQTDFMRGATGLTPDGIDGVNRTIANGGTPAGINPTNGGRAAAILAAILGLGFQPAAGVKFSLFGILPFEMMLIDAIGTIAGGLVALYFLVRGVVFVGRKVVTAISTAMASRKASVTSRSTERVAQVPGDGSGQGAADARAGQTGLGSGRVSPTGKAAVSGQSAAEIATRKEAARAESERRIRKMIQDAGLTEEDLLNMNSPAAKKKVLEYNVKVGGLKQIIGDKAPNDALAKPFKFSETATREEKIALLQAVSRRERAWFRFSAGRATRLKMPAVFDKLGIIGFTAALLKRLAALGHEEEKNVPQEKDFEALVARAQNGIVENVDDLSFGQRGVIQLRRELEKLVAEVGADAGVTLQQILDGVVFIDIANETNLEAISHQLAGIGFAGFRPENVFVSVQPEVGGLQVQPDGSVAWSDAERFPQGHGEPMIAVAERVDDNFTFAANGQRVALGTTLNSALDRTGVQEMIFGQSNDLTWFTDASMATRWSAGLAAMEQTGAGMVMEMVDNAKGPDGEFMKGGGAFADAAGKAHLRDSLAIEGGAKPAFLSRMRYILKRAAVGALRWKDAIWYLNPRTGRSGASIVTEESYSGDSSTPLGGAIINSPGDTIKVFKSRPQIPQALAAMNVQNGLDDGEFRFAALRLAGVPEATLTQAAYTPEALPSATADAAALPRVLSDARLDANRVALVNGLLTRLNLRGIAKVSIVDSRRNLFLSSYGLRQPSLEIGIDLLRPATGLRGWISAIQLRYFVRREAVRLSYGAGRPDLDELSFVNDLYVLFLFVVPNSVVFGTKAADSLIRRQPFSPAVPVAVGILAAIAALLAAQGFVPAGLDAASGYISLAFGIIAAVVALVGLASAAVNGNAVDVPADATVNSLRSDGRFNARRLGFVERFAAAAGVTKVTFVANVRPEGEESLFAKLARLLGVSADVNPVTGELRVGTGLLVQGNFVGNLIRGLLLHIILAHEIVHLKGPQVRWNNGIGTVVNEIIAYSLGFFMIIGLFLVVPSASAATAVAEREVDFRTEVTNRAVAQRGENLNRFILLMRALLGNPKYIGTSSNIPANVAINGDDYLVGMSVEGQTAFERLFRDLHAAAANGLTPGSEVPLYTADPANLAVLTSQAAMLNRAVPGITFTAQVRAPGADIVSLFSANVQKNVSLKNTVVLAKDRSDFQLPDETGALQPVHFVAILGESHLALAAFVYTRYQPESGDEVLRELIDIFTKLTPLELEGRLTNQLMGEIAAMLAA